MKTIYDFTVKDADLNDFSLSDNLKVMDSSAISMARDNFIPMVVFSILKSNSFLNATLGKGNFTLISEEKWSHLI